MNRRLAVLAEDPSVLALAHGGDYIFSGWKLDQWQAWLDDAELAVPASGRLLPIVPTRGNHEAGGQMFDEVFGWPGGGLGKNFFVTELSDEVALVTLNTERAAGGVQREFLERALREHGDKLFRVVQYHRPIWPAVKAPYPGKYQWQPLFEALGVAFVLESDGHALKRTVPLRDDKQVEGGVVYLGEGGLGVKQRTPYASRWYLQPPGMSSSAHHVWRLDFGADAVTAIAIGVDGAELDRTVLPPRPPDDGD